MPRKAAPPSLKFHKASGQGYVILSGKRHYVGPFDAPDTKLKAVA